MTATVADGHTQAPTPGVAVAILELATWTDRGLCGLALGMGVQFSRVLCTCGAGFRRTPKTGLGRS